MPRINNTVKTPRVDTSEDRDYDLPGKATKNTAGRAKKLQLVTKKYKPDASIDPLVEAFLVPIRQVNDPTWVFEEQNIEQLAAMSPAQYAQAVNELKKLFSGSVDNGGIDLRKLKGAVSAVSRVKLQAPFMAGELPVLDVTNMALRDASQAALDALLRANVPPTLFVREGKIVRVTRNEKGRPKIQYVDVDILRGCMTRSATFVKLSGRQYANVAPPQEVVRDVLSMSATAFPPIDGIVETPIVRRDGTIASTAGYDPMTHLYLSLAPDFNMPAIPTHPTQEDARTAVAALDEVIGDFPFATKADKDNEIALLLTLVMRPAIRGLVPMAVVDAPMAGTGKGLLASANVMLATGVEAATKTAPTSEEEWEKALMSSLGDGETVLLIDNVRGVLRSAKLESFLTAKRFSGRLLGFGTNGTYDNRVTPMMTGNNMQLGNDLPRRAYQIRLDAKDSHPEDRKDFTHTPLIPWVEEHRGEPLAALFTIISAWFAAGKPTPACPVTPMGSFEEWTGIMDGILAYAGCTNFLGNRQRLRDQSAPDTDDWESFLVAWYERFGNRPMKSDEIEIEAQNNTEFRTTDPCIEG
jgi:hypothetical protein